jgi:adenylate kinase family enzyme
MNEVTIILGAQFSGKTTLAKKLASGKKSISISSDELLTDSWLKKINEETEIIIVDEVVSFKQVQSLIENSIITFRKPYGITLTTIKRPELIIVSSVLTKSDFKDLYVIELK